MASALLDRLQEVGCDREPFTPDHAKCICRLTGEAADEIERLRIELAQALRQWRTYAEMVEDRELKTEQTPEAEMYRQALKLTNQ